MLQPLAPSDRLKFILPQIYEEIDEHYLEITNEIDEKLLQPQTVLFWGHFLLPFVTIYQFLEGLCDHQCVNLLSSRTDWHKSLHLSGTIQVIPENYLCDYRKWLLAEKARLNEFQGLMDRIYGLDDRLAVYSGVSEGIDLLRSLCYVHQIEILHDTLTRVLETLAYHYPDFLRNIAKPNWFVNYRVSSSEKIIKYCRGHYVESFQNIKDDMAYLLGEIQKSNLENIQYIPEVIVLNRVWKRLVQLESDSSFDPYIIDCSVYSSLM